ncbi:phage tail sheath subtilisin-like domain-containing protein [Sphingomonas hengshuiensis]|uniref:Phage tail protein n=1 Tax=Sphingomonas hengshuiensis TaxID=1609977 RepID=A0A7U4LG41_9SPHN|nr:phage tail sheath subtilisin-like domain-containing protein [Sphingomonas hengshuiensis]AJP73167.1 hypothetical protein TS85_17280 [Sphingomonas hengshuiensis]
MTSIVFDSIASNQRRPGVAAEFSNVRAVSGLPPAPQKILLVGQKLATGSSALVPQRMTSADQAVALFGRGSMLHGMVRAALKASGSTEVWAIGVEDNSGGVSGVVSLTYTGTATAAGTVSILVAGVRIQMAAIVGTTATQMATATAAAINALPDLPVVATSSAGVVTVTARHKGAVAGDALGIIPSYYEGDGIPAGLSVAIATVTAPSGDPDLDDVWAVLGDEQFQSIALFANDSANLTSADVELASRWGPERQVEGHAFTTIRSTYSTLATFGATRNGPHLTVVASDDLQVPSWVITATVAALYAVEIEKDPARQLTKLVLPGIPAPRRGYRFTKMEREQLLHNGISTLDVSPSGEVVIERLISTYRVNAYGLPDISWLDVNTAATLAYYRYSWRYRMQTKFPRAKLTADTIAAIRAETINLAREWGEAGLMEDVDGFIAGLVIERDATNPTQLNLLMTPDVVNGLLQLMARFEFIL